MNLQSILLRGAVLAAAAILLSGCLAMAVGGAAVGVAGTAVGVTGKAVVMTAKGAGAVVGAVIPGGDKKKDSGGS
jgi:hypothetical protein